MEQPGRSLWTASYDITKGLYIAVLLILSETGEFAIAALWFFFMYMALTMLRIVSGLDR